MRRAARRQRRGPGTAEQRQPIPRARQVRHSECGGRVRHIGDGSDAPVEPGPRLGRADVRPIAHIGHQDFCATACIFDRHARSQDGAGASAVGGRAREGGEHAQARDGLGAYVCRCGRYGKREGQCGAPGQ